MGIERVVHPDSLETLISEVKRTLVNPEISRTHTIFLKNKQKGKLRVRNSIYPLSDPVGTFLSLVEPEGD